MNNWPENIPKNIYITCNNKSNYPDILFKNLSELNPGFTINIYGDKECIDFLEKYFSKDYANFFNRIPDGAIKADFWRACILYIFGGIYLDADVILKIPLINVIDKETTFLTSGSKDKNRVNPIILISEKGEPILKDTIESIYNCRNIKYEYWKYSICVHMKPIIDKYIPNYKENKSETYIINKKKYKFLREVFVNKQYVTSYKGKIILYNHNKEYWKHNKGFINNKKVCLVYRGFYKSNGKYRTNGGNNFNEDILKNNLEAIRSIGVGNIDIYFHTYSFNQEDDAKLVELLNKYNLKKYIIEKNVNKKITHSIIESLKIVENNYDLIINTRFDILFLQPLNKFIIQKDSLNVCFKDVKSLWDKSNKISDLLYVLEPKYKERLIMSLVKSGNTCKKHTGHLIYNFFNNEQYKINFMIPGYFGSNTDNLPAKNNFIEIQREEINNKRIGILIPGELRFFNKKYLNIFINKLKGYDIFISTYKKYEYIAKLITNNYIILDESKYNPEQTNIYQWIHLQNLISHYKDKLIEYKILLKFRTDIIFQKNFFNIIEPIEKTIYCFTDFIFFGLTEHFLYVFENIYDKIMQNYWGKDKEYIDIDYKNFLNAKISTFKFMWLRMPLKIISKDFIKLQENILLNLKLIEDREKVRKEKMRTYKNFKENGKFVSEKIIVLHVVNNGFIEGISYNFSLLKNRKNYKFT